MSGLKEESLGRIQPDRVRFTQSSVSHRFRDGRTIAEFAAALKAGQINPEDVPPIRLFEKDGVYYTLDNRRLEAFRRAGIDVPYRVATPEEIESERWKFTTTNGGVSVRVRGEPDERAVQSEPGSTDEPRSNGS